MNKIINHIKNNILIYLILITCLIVIAVVHFYTKGQVDDPVVVDTQYFNVIDLKETVKLFEDDSPKMLILSVRDCPATEKYVTYVRIVQMKEGFTSYFLDLNTIKGDEEEFKQLLDKLDEFEYDYNGQKGTLKTFLGNTPLTVFIKDGRIVYGRYGSMNENVLDSFVTKYGVGKNG